MLLFVALWAMYPSVTACAVPPPLPKGRLWDAHTQGEERLPLRRKSKIFASSLDKGSRGGLRPLSIRNNN